MQQLRASYAPRAVTSMRAPSDGVGAEARPSAAASATTGCPSSLPSHLGRVALLVAGLGQLLCM